VPELPRRASGPGAVLLRDDTGEVVRLDCARCDRRGAYRLAVLIERFGPAAGLPDVLSVLAGNCPRRGMGRFSDPCGAGFPELAALARAGSVTPTEGPRPPPQ
jgi:hypothetical protein